jgi:23S rRNA (uracil1939-C5)-methyltransferase
VNADEPIVRIASRGDGVTASGRHVSMTAPGDLVDADGSITPGPHRQQPPCRHFPECGGCQLQHVDDAAYEAFLADRISWALSAQGIAAPELRPAHLSPAHSRRRAALSASRQADRILLGFKEEGSHRIVDMRECHILRPELFTLVGPLRDLLRVVMGRRQATVRLTLADQGLDVLIEGVDGEGLEAAEALTVFARTHSLARLAVDSGYGAEARWEPEPVTVTFGGVPVGLPANAFLQATQDGEAALVAAVREVMATAHTAADLFAGLGTFAFSLEGKVVAVEASRDAAMALQAAAQRNRRPITVEHRDLYRRPFDPSELGGFGAVVLDPPRAGAQEQVKLLARSTVPRIAYVSCNPSTFGRDARILVEGGYRIDWVKPIGQFRWSTHVELVCAFSK